MCIGNPGPVPVIVIGYNSTPGVSVTAFDRAGNTGAAGNEGTRGRANRGDTIEAGPRASCRSIRVADMNANVSPKKARMIPSFQAACGVGAGPREHLTENEICLGGAKFGGGV